MHIFYESQDVDRFEMIKLLMKPPNGCAVSHFPQRQQGQDYSGEKRRDCFSSYSCFLSLLTSLEFDREQDAWECARYAVDDYLQKKKLHFFCLFSSHCCHRPERSPGVPVSTFRAIFINKKNAERSPSANHNFKTQFKRNVRQDS